MLKNLALDTIKKYNLIKDKEHIIVGISGGADSVTLLHFLNEISVKFYLKLTAVHINHGIRKEALEDEEFVKDFCKKLSIPLKTFNFNIKKEAKFLSLSEEETGRIFRYKAFSKVLNEVKADKIAVAHNKNDNAETLLLNMFRGSGLKGLSGISFKRENIIRPLLECDRKQIEDYCIKNNLDYITDATNNLTIYTRNKIRLDLIPYLKENFNKNLITTLANTANNLKEEENFLDKLASDLLEKVTIQKSKNFLIIDINLLENNDIVLIKRVFRKICLNFTKSLKNITSKHINSLLDLLKKQSGKSLNLPYNITFKKEHNTIFVTNSEININYSYPLSLDSKIYIKEINKFVYFTKNSINNKNFSKKVYTIALNYDNIKDNLILRNRINGDKIFLNRINNYKKIKDLFIDLKIPLHIRNSIPILVNDKDIVAALSIEVSGLFKANENTNNIAYVHYWEE